MESTLLKLLESFKGKRLESYIDYDTYKQEILYLYKKKLNDEIPKLPNGFWAGEDGLINSRIVIDYVIEEILHMKIEDMPDILNHTFFRTHMLSGIARQHNSSVDLIMTLYPGMFNLYEFKISPRHMWDREDKFDIARGLIQHNLDKYGYTVDDIYNVSWAEFFIYDNMANMYKKLFNNDVIKALNFTFEGIVIKREDIMQIGKWNDDTLCYEVINKLLKITNKDIDELLLEDIKKFNYYSLVTRRFKNIKNVKVFYKNYK